MTICWQLVELCAPYMAAVLLRVEHSGVI